MTTEKNHHPIALGFGALAIIVIVGLVLIFRYLDIQKERELGYWRSHLGLIADARVSDVDSWLYTQFTQLEEVANNASLQLYLSQLATRTRDAQVEPAQLGYLRNLLIASAERYQFSGATSQPTLPANIKTSKHSGLSLYNQDGEPLISTSGFPALTTTEQSLISTVLQSGKSQLLDIRLSADEIPIIGFAVPIQGIQGMQSAGAIGVMVGFKPAQQSLYPLLESRGALTEQDETLLIAARDGLITYLSPDREGTIPTKRQLAVNTSNLAAASAIATPGSFAQVQDYRGIEVLMTSRPLTRAPWLLVQKTDARAALQDANAHRRFLLTAFLLTLFVISASLIAAWRHGSSVRAQAVARQLKQYSETLEKQTRLLHGVTDNIKDLILLLTNDHILIFGNQSLAGLTRMPVEDFAGKGLSSVIGPDTARRLLEHLEQTANDPTGILTLSIAEQEGQYQCTALQVPNPNGSGNAQLIVLHDVTELEAAQRKRTLLHRQLITALMRAVDKHDPYSADHSSRVASVAVAIARQLDLDEATQQTISLAANLANVGKIFIPTDVLTKTGQLTAEEHALLQKHVDYSLEILSALPFDGPVLETIAQKQEHMDGSGYPNGLGGEEIILPARILAVANSFVALVSPRAYREAITITQAFDQLMDQSNSRYDRQVVAALLLIGEQELNNPSH